MSGTDMLEADLDNAGGGSGDKDSKQSQAELIHALDDVISERHPKRKSNIEWTTLNGIIRANSLNTYCEKYFKFKVATLDMLIIDRMEYVSSIGGLGKKDTIKIIEAVKAVIEAHGEVGVTDRLLGVNK